VSLAPFLHERIEQTDFECLKVLVVAGGNGQVMGQGGRGDQGIFKVVIRASVHQARPASSPQGLDERSKLLLRWAAIAVKESSPIQREAQQPAIPALDLRNSMLVEVGPKEDEPPKKVEQKRAAFYDSIL
jgi:hypothetical protein